METEHVSTLANALVMIRLTLSFLMLGSVFVAAVSSWKKRFGHSVLFWHLVVAFSATGLLMEVVIAELRSTSVSGFSIFWCVLTVACALFNAHMDARRVAKNEPNAPS